jgi:3-hydroxyisobutyrate dehydrogenase/glyoxylate/succinic semialdehyde reductase
MKIGFIGLGIMGSRMAVNLANAGYTIFVYNRTALKISELNVDNLVAKSNPALVAGESDVIITMLSTPEAVQDVALSEEGLCAGMSKGKVWMDCSTVNPTFSKQMAELSESLGFNFLDAPVAGSLVPAEKGELIFLVGGKNGVVKYCEPLFKVMGKKHIHVGENGMGSALKLVNNLIMGISMYGIVEGLVLGESLGITKKIIFDILNGSPIAAQMIQMKRGKIEKNDYSPEFPLQWLQKDLQLAADTGYEQNIAMPATNIIKEIFALANKAGYAEQDFTAIYPFLSHTKMK